jgi:hypothetical protein
MDGGAVFLKHDQGWAQFKSFKGMNSSTSFALKVGLVALAGMISACNALVDVPTGVANEGEEWHPQEAHLADSSVMKNGVWGCAMYPGQWTPIRQFETANYHLHLCLRGDSLKLFGQNKAQGQLINAVAWVDGDTLWARDEKHFLYEIRQGQLTVKQHNKVVVKEMVQISSQ